MNDKSPSLDPLLALSPCPFCGNPASIEWGPTGRYVGVECNTCGALGGEQKNIPHDADRDAFERLAITAWNTRAANARGDGELPELYRAGEGVAERSESGRSLTSADVYNDLALIRDNPLDKAEGFVRDVCQDAMNLIAPMFMAANPAEADTVAELVKAVRLHEEACANSILGWVTAPTITAALAKFTLTPAAYGQQCAATRPAEVGGDGWLPIESAPEDGTPILIAAMEDGQLFDVLHGHFEVLAEDEEDGPWDIRDGEPWCSYEGRTAGIYFCHWLPGKEWESRWKFGPNTGYTHWQPLPPALGSEVRP